MTAIVDELIAALGQDCVRVGEAIPERNRDNTSLASELTPTTPTALVLPRSTADVSKALTICHKHGHPVVTQGGMTGLAGGAHPEKVEIALSLERMSGIEEIDTASGTMTVLAGTPLQLIHEAAEKAGFMYGVDLGARGSCTIGGNVSTNAGGNQVLRYGMTRRNVLGMEAVLADGTVLTSLNKMLKNNTGYDWVQLMIGAEGTLGVVTRVVVALHARPEGVHCLLCALDSLEDAVKLLRATERTFPGGLLTFEGMWSEFYEVATGPVMGCSAPLPRGHEIYVLMEIATGPETEEAGGGVGKVEEHMGALLENGIIKDCVIAQSGQDRARIWALRESPYDWKTKMPPATAANFDISVPIARMSEFVARMRQAIPGRWPNAMHVSFGHMADSNLHVNVRVPPQEAGPGTKEEVEQVVYGIVGELKGSISAEHGIGRHKKPYLHLSRSAPELALMRTIKTAMDPKGILNPGRIF